MLAQRGRQCRSLSSSVTTDLARPIRVCLKLIQERFPGAEMRNQLGRYEYRFSGFWISGRASGPMMHRKTAKSPNFNPAALLERIGHGAEDQLDGDLAILLDEMRELACEAMDEFGLRHAVILACPVGGCSLIRHWVGKGHHGLSANKERACLDFCFGSLYCIKKQYASVSPPNARRVP